MTLIHHYSFKDSTDLITKQKIQLNNGIQINNDGPLEESILINASQKQYIDCGMLDDVCGELSFSFFIKPAQKQERNPKIFGAFDNSKGCALCYYETKYYFFIASGNSFTFGGCEFYVKLTPDVWQSVIIVVGAATKKIYVNGANQIEKQQPGLPAKCKKQFEIGGGRQLQCINGSISDFRIYKGELSEQQITDISELDYSVFYRNNKEEIERVKQETQYNFENVQKLHDQIYKTTQERKSIEQETQTLAQFLTQLCE